jgi:hypothetical protein
LICLKLQLSLLRFPSKNEWFGYGPWIEHRDEVIKVAQILIELGLRLCELLLSCNITTGLSGYLNDLSCAVDTVLLTTAVQELAIAVEFTFRLLKSEAGNVSAKGEAFPRQWQSLQQEFILVIRRFDAMFLTSELSYLLSQFSCLGDGSKEIFIMSVLRTAMRDCTAEDIIRHLCIGLNSVSYEEQLYLSGSQSKLLCRFFGTIYKVMYINYIYSLIFNFLLSPGHLPLSP